MVRFFFFLISISSAFKRTVWKWWYQRLAAFYQKKDWRFMNYGYAPIGKESTLILSREDDEKNRLFIQLYQHILFEITLTGKKILEIGSGRGGGSDYIARYYQPAQVIGVDFSSNAVALANRFYNIPTLSFIEGNAEDLPFENNSFDVVCNVESSHCYGNMKAFVSEVKRVLKPGGIFSWADLRSPKEMEELELVFKQSQLIILSKEDITLHVVRALDLFSEEKEESIRKSVPSYFQYPFREFAGVRASKIYQSFKNGTMVYYHYRFQKPEEEITG
jgi:ubiquinone/menaquinone biosynthesis C-methylase UbiE